MKHQNQVPNSNKRKRLLVVIELSTCIKEDAWNRMYLASKQSFASDSKIIVTSCSDKIVRFGTAWALTLKYLSKKAYWYFFKTLTFGRMDLDTHPRICTTGNGDSQTAESFNQWCIYDLLFVEEQF